ncbi:PLDc N-terminal domain-containing protein [Nocardia harenae]|uniref:PLDc N-terminal domain-containing protein n=1 Tax=Nocardia harenae TaxID=358707 RepID=UPI00082FF3F6|nr:PLDc N-terminal domain-containing protein [Nocardia harenae]
MSFWEIVGVVVVSFLFAAYLIVLFRIVTDLFRDHTTSGWGKAGWIVALVLLPLLAAVLYVVLRGPGMAERAQAASLREWEARNDYIRVIAGTDTVARIGEAGRLLDSGTITEAEFARIKDSVIGR